jgi:hypothetical protein
MTKKDLQRVQADLAALAEPFPTQNVGRRGAVKQHPASGIEEGEEVIQFSLSLRKSLRKELARLAADMTMRAFVLSALKEKGLNVSDEDLVDLRTRRRVRAP